MMNRWKPTINSAATSVTHLLVEKNRTSGAAISTVVPLTCAMKSASRDGRSWTGSRGNGPVRTHLGANIVLLTIGGMTLEKCFPNFEKPAPTHTTTITHLERNDHVW